MASIERLFLSVGAMKAGTTWLHQQLAGHPDIQFCPEKEIHYFADPDGKAWMSRQGRLERYQRIVRNLQPERLSAHARRNLAWYPRVYLSEAVSDDWYVSLFEDPPANKKNTVYKADFSNLYATMPITHWSRVRSVAGNVRAIFSMRHPAERLWSSLKFHYEFIGNTAELDRFEAEDYSRFLDDPNTREHSNYAGAIERLHSVLNKKELEVFFFEDFREEPLRELRRLEAFLDISPGDYAEDRFGKKVNKSEARSVPKAFAEAANRIHEQQCNRLVSMGYTLPESWSKGLS